jgi:N6-adenosine-specific RNA methylase IME4
MDRAADNHYPTVTVAKLLEMKAPAAKNAVLFLWATAPMMPQALEVMKAWGFDYKSQCVWAKNRIGTGYWFRNKHELLLVGTRGKKLPAPAAQPSIIEAPVRGHSVKPDAFAEMIVKMFPTSPRIEMFARKKRAGWDTWGNEIPG